MKLSPCPDSPNCVSSDATRARHRIAPLKFTTEPALAWQTLQAVIQTLPRTKIIALTDDYLHAEARSRVFGFVDDVEFCLQSSDSEIAVRSASRAGHWDIGVNRKRIEKIRGLFQAHCQQDAD